MTMKKTRGWIKSQKLYHYYSTGRIISLCTMVELRFNKIKNMHIQYLLDHNVNKNTPLCSECKRLKNILFEKENTRIRKASTLKWELKERKCSESGCNDNRESLLEPRDQAFEYKSLCLCNLEL